MVGVLALGFARDFLVGVDVGGAEEEEEEEVGAVELGVIA
jgi:hypothetical protein